MHLQLARWRRGVNAFSQAHKGNPQQLELIEQRHEVLEASAEPIQAPADQHIELPALGITDQLIQGRALILGVTDALVGVLVSRPAPSLYVLA